MKHPNISLRDANQNFSRLIAAVERGESFCITRRGQEVARLLPSPTVGAPDTPLRGGATGKVLPVMPIPVQETTHGERILRLEARVDKLSAAIPSIINKPSPT